MHPHRVEPDPGRLDAMKKLMGHRSHVLDAPGRQIVLRAIQEVCARARMLIAAHVRTTHVQVVVEAHSLPEAVMHDFQILCHTASRSAPRTEVQTLDPAWKQPGTCGRTTT